MIRVALVDDQAIVRAGLARILSPTDGFDVVAECVSGHEAVERLRDLRPDVILMDIRMPGLDASPPRPGCGRRCLAARSSCSPLSARTRSCGVRSRPGRRASCSRTAPPRT